MKRLFNICYILAYVLTMLCMLIIFLVTLPSTLFKFPPSLLSLTVFLATLAAFYASIVVHRKHGRGWHVIVSTLVPLILIMLPLYYIVPAGEQAAKEVERYIETYGEENFTFQTMMDISQATAQAHHFHSMEHLREFFTYDAISVWAPILLILTIYVGGQYMRVRKDKKYAVL